MSELLPFALHLLVLAVVAWLGLLLWGIRSYAGKKGENLATRQDVRDITCEIEDVKAEIETHAARLQWVQRAQFDLEFEHLQKVWIAVSVARRKSRVGGIDLPFDHVTFNQARNHFRDAINELRSVVDDSSPFYPRDIYEGLGELIQLCDMEYRRSLSRNPGQPDHDPNWFDWRDTAHNEIVEKTGEIADRIRSYMGEVAGAE